MSYTEKLEQEILSYRDVVNVSELPEIYSYWSNKFLRPKLESLGFSNSNEFYVEYVKPMALATPDSVCRILSLGAGNCDTEINLAESLEQSGVKNFAFDCLDVNPQMLTRGKQLAQERCLSSHFNFFERDINNWEAQTSYDIVIANQCLHHFVELELLFEKTHQCLQDKGFFLTNDMIGRNGHMRWPEALELVHALWSLLDEKYKWNHQLRRQEAVYENWDCSIWGGFEGVRAQDILPLLVKTFHFDSFIGFGNLINVFVDRGFGCNFHVSDPKDCVFIDFVAGLDDYFIESGKIKPTQMLAAMTKSEMNPVKIYKHLTPAFCIRDPNL
jgi:SAM-dependent methyltransferase